MNLKQNILSGLLLKTCLFLLLYLQTSLAFAGDWRVSPLKIELSENTKTGIFRVYNDAPENLIVEITASEWIQDEKGQDKYIDTSDLIFFPRVMTIKQNDKRIIRVGSKNFNTEKEKAYRLFIREVIPRKDEKKSGVAVAVQFALPVFISARAPKPALEIASASYGNGALSIILSNNSNTHVTLRSITINGTSRSGTSLFNGQLRGWYLLAGASRTYSYELPPGACSETGTIAIKVEAEGLNAVAKDILLENSVCGEQQ